MKDLKKSLFAWGMAQANKADDQAIQIRDCEHYTSFAQLKQTLLGDLTGKVVEIGPGAGANLAYYQNNINWLGIEPNPFMHSYLKQEAIKLGLTNIELKQGTAEELNVEDNSTDVVVSTHVLCSVSSLEKALEEIKRILEPGGKFVFIEHVGAECGTWKRKWQNAIAPAWKSLFDNCHPNRDIGITLQNAGFEQISYHNFQLNFPVVSPHIAGTAKV